MEKYIIFSNKFGLNNSISYNLLSFFFPKSGFGKFAVLMATEKIMLIIAPYDTIRLRMKPNTFKTERIEESFVKNGNYFRVMEDFNLGLWDLMKNENNLMVHKFFFKN
ncbi:hypothetical protein [Metabacillus litoralis]|uniref:hypothetical protein n=1 Tax=Metabacillus litoralis TaxID=152268 RepID=UPI001CFEFF71|nr:hypothetical protein [Metabacillus litoralis]